MTAAKIVNVVKEKAMEDKVTNFNYLSITGTRAWPPNSL